MRGLKKVLFNEMKAMELAKIEHHIVEKRKSIELRSEISVISDYKNMTIIRGLHHSDEVYIEIDKQLNLLREELLLMYFPNILSMAKRYKLDMNILFYVNSGVNYPN